MMAKPHPEFLESLKGDRWRATLTLAAPAAVACAPKPHKARAPRAGDGAKRSCVTIRFTENELGRADVTALRLGMDRSTLAREAIELFVQAADDAWYFHNIGAAPCPSIDAVVEAARALMAAEVNRRFHERLRSDFAADMEGSDQ
jgi:hypothetical protein